MTDRQIYATWNCVWHWSVRYFTSFSFLLRTNSYTCMNHKQNLAVSSTFLNTGENNFASMLHRVANMHIIEIINTVLFLNYLCSFTFDDYQMRFIN